MKRHNLFKVVLLAVLVAIILTWILPIVTFDGNYGLVADGTKQEVGIFSILTYVGVAIQYFSYIGIFVLSVGGLYGVLHVIPAYRKLIDKIVKSFKNKEWLFIAIIMLFIAGVAAFANMYLAIIFLFPFVIAVILAMGYDRITAALATCGSVCAGLIGSAFSVSNSYGFDQILGTTAKGNWKMKLIVFVIAVAIVIVYTIMHAKKHKDSNDVDNEIYVPAKQSKTRGNFIPLLICFDLVLVILIISMISWKDTFGIELFSKIHETVGNFAILDYPILNKLLGLNNALGAWNLVEGTVVIVIAAYVLSFIYRVKFNDFLSSFMNGCEKTLKPALLVVLVYVVLVVTTYVPYVLGIVKPIIDLTDTLNVFTMSLTVFISSLFSVESYYASMSTGALPYAMSVYQDLTAGDINLLALIWQSIYGLTMLVAPTSVVLLATLGYLNVPYHKWLQGVWKVLLILLFVLLAFFLIVAII